MRSSTSEASLAAVAAARSELIKTNVEVLEAGDFGRARELTSLLEELKRLEDRLVELLAGRVAAPDHARVAREASRPAQSSSAPGSSYPRFVRRGNSIVKIGLNRDQGGVYEKQLPYERFLNIQGVLIDLSRTDREFGAKRPIASATAPAYQVHLVLHVLEEQGLVIQPTRGTYRFPRPLSPSDFQAAWARVPEES